jgi:hypothetical protein
LHEAQKSDYLGFIDDDELPHLDLLNAAYDALKTKARIARVGA